MMLKMVYQLLKQEEIIYECKFNGVLGCNMK